MLRLAGWRKQRKSGALVEVVRRDADTEYKYIGVVHCEVSEACRRWIFNDCVTLSYIAGS